MIDVVIADDELPALDELDFLLRGDERVGTVHRATGGAEAIQLLTTVSVQAAFLDIHMPGLSGFDLARAIRRFAIPPAIVFVTADEDRALDAFELEATDYLLKPVRAERLARSISRIVQADTAPIRGQRYADETIVATLGSTIRRLRRSEVRYAQAQGDYTRLHTETASYLIRTPISDLELHWAGGGFLRVHRSFLVAIDAVSSIRLGQNPTVTAAGVELPVSRRLLPAVRETLATSARRGAR